MFNLDTKWNRPGVSNAEGARERDKIEDRKESIMNNEERILEMLVEMKAAQDEMKAAQEEMKAAQDEMKVSFEKRFDSIEERLDEIDTRSLRSAVLLETEVARDIRLVYEGQELLRQKVETLAPKDRVEALESDVAMMKDVIKLMRQDIAELKKAQ